MASSSAVLLQAQLMKRSGGQTTHEKKGGKISKRNATFSSGNLMKKWDSRHFQLTAQTLSYFGTSADDWGHYNFWSLIFAT